IGGLKRRRPLRRGGHRVDNDDGAGRSGEVKRRRFAGAFTMTEMLFVLVVLGFVAAQGGRLFSATIRLAHASAEAQNTAATTESAINALRGDAWSADRFSAGDAS